MKVVSITYEDVDDLYKKLSIPIKSEPNDYPLSDHSDKCSNIIITNTTEPYSIFTDVAELGCINQNSDDN